MSTIITERKMRRHSVYYLLETDEAGNEVERRVYDTKMTTRVHDGYRVIDVYSSAGEIIPEVFYYVNVTKRGASLASRMQMAVALNLFHVFCELYSYKPSEITNSRAAELVQFLRGNSVRADAGYERSIRSPKTVNGYYGMIKRYIASHSKWRQDILVHTVTTTVEFPVGDVSITTQVSRDANMLRDDPQKKYERPMHLTPEQVNRLAELMRQAKDERGLLLVRLQYTHGLRSGEALGLTTEDLTFRNYEGRNRYYITLRNRVSDRPWQSAKLLMHPQRKDEYDSVSYRNSKAGRVEISEDLYKSIMSYYHSSRNPDKVSKKILDRIERETLADSVLPVPLHGIPPTNHYIFVGNNGRLFSGQTWNNHLKRYFVRLGIPIDEGFKQSNCSHRLRHGFAMFHAQYSKTPVNQMQLRTLMRHSSSLSCLAYYTPDNEDILRMKERFHEELRESVPELYSTIND